MGVVVSQSIILTGIPVKLDKIVYSSPDIEWRVSVCSALIGADLLIRRTFLLQRTLRQMHRRRQQELNQQP